MKNIMIFSFCCLILPVTGFSSDYFSSISHESSIPTKDVGHTFIGIGVENHHGNFYFSGEIKTPIGQNESHDDGNWNHGEPIGEITVKYYLGDR